MVNKHAYALLCRKVYDIQLKLIQKMILSNLYNHYTFFVFIDENSQNINTFEEEERLFLESILSLYDEKNGVQ